MESNDVVRGFVREAYKLAVEGEKGCCGGDRKGTVVHWAGYDEETLATLPDEVLNNAFGCGNPLAFSEVKPGEVVLDLGSGAGIDLLLASRIVGPKGKVIGVDMTDEMIAKARQNIAADGATNIDVRKGIIEELPVEDGSVDWVISNCVINLSPEKERVFAEIARVLKPGGRMQVSDLVAVDLPEYVKRNRFLRNTCIAGAISEEEYLDGLQAAGLGEAKVLERIRYDASQVKGLLDSERYNADTGSSCGCGCGVGAEGLEGEALETAIRDLTGKVWSSKIFARKPESSMADRKKVLILCTGNSCRSIMAEALINHDLSDQWQAFSAGVEPSKLNLRAEQVMAELGISLEGYSSKGVEEFLQREDLDLVVTVCDHARETCPVFPHPVEQVHVGFEDPAPFTDEPDTVALPKFREVRDNIRQELIEFLRHRS